MGSFYGYRYKGVCQNKDATYARDADGNVMKDISGNAIVMRNGTATIAPGDALYEDINHDGVINQYEVTLIRDSPEVLVLMSAISNLSCLLFFTDVMDRM